MDNIKLEVKIGQSYARIKHDDYYIGAIYVSPTHNCQLSSIGDFEECLSRLSNHEIKFLMKLILKYTGKHLLLLDIRKTKLKGATDIFKDCIVSQTLYESTNKSNMVLLLVNINNYILKDGK